MRFLKGLLLTAGVLLVLAGVAFYLRPVEIYDDFTYLQQAFHGVQGRWTWVDGHTIHYEVEGPAQGQPVVLVHGLGGRADNWRALAPYLADAGYRVYMPDLVGYGRSDSPGNFSYSIRDEAAIVIGFLDSLGLNRVDLGGWSMGGWIVQVAAFQHPQRIKHLMIFDAAGLYAMPDFDPRLFAPANVQQLRKLDALLMPHPPAIPGFIAADILRVSKDTNWVVSRAVDQMLTGRDVVDPMLPHLKMPMLIEWGARDEIIPVNQAEKIHRLVPQSELQLYTGCGHLAPLQCADQIGPNVVRYLERTPADNPAPTPSQALTSPEPPKQPRSDSLRLQEASSAQLKPDAQSSLQKKASGLLIPRPNEQPNRENP